VVSRIYSRKLAVEYRWRLRECRSAAVTLDSVVTRFKRKSLYWLGYFDPQTSRLSPIIVRDNITFEFMSAIYIYSYCLRTTPELSLEMYILL